MRIISKVDVSNALTMKEAIEVMEEGFSQYYDKKVLQPLRTTLNTNYGVNKFYFFNFFESQPFLCLPTFNLQEV
jgi:ornithine cyclodeaminase/alanine dehydrogenase-like protein (mu-crystallin family)